MYEKFFQSIDALVGKGDMSCHEFAEFYWSFFNELKEWRCTSSGFTGMSELLVFRLVVNLLGGAFKTVSISRDLRVYIRENDKIRIEQGHGLHLDETFGTQKTIVPDLAIFKEDTLQAITSIKVYITRSEDLKKETEKLAYLQKEKFVRVKTVKETKKVYIAEDLKILLLVFYRLGSTHEKQLSDFAHDKPWFKYHALLDDKSHKISEIIEFILENIR